MILNQDYNFVMRDYQKQKPFSSFLSGIAGKLGKPLWAFYVNRGQGITSFGIRDKNGAISEFYPANLAYIYTSTIGFRTFIKVDGKIHEFFKENNSNQEMVISRHELSISEENIELGIKVNITYFTLPNMSFPGLVRLVEIKNLKKEKREITLVDGLMQILPPGVDYGGYKSVSNLLQSWMYTDYSHDFLFYKLTSSTGDEAEVKEASAGNYYYTIANNPKEFKYIYDYKALFKEDSSFSYPYGLLNNDIFNYKQTNINQVPSALTATSFSLEEKYVQTSIFGFKEDLESLTDDLKQIDFPFLNKKREENKDIHDKLVHDIKTETNNKMFDEYLKQNYLDNLMRGGTPFLLNTNKGDVAYHLYSRKHGDLERDYNFFSIEPSFYSQGNGNFRDVLQNRRNDLLFNPLLKDFNIYYFFSLIQRDGYNPLSIEGVKFKYLGVKPENKIIDEILSKDYTLGELTEGLKSVNQSLDLAFSYIKESEPIIVSNYGEGYWQDHFTYLYDLIDSYLSIYPDLEKDLLFLNKNYLYFNSPIRVRSRDEKYVLTKDLKVRQFGALEYLDNYQSRWLTYNDKLVTSNLIGKLITLTTNKYALLDPYGIGIMYEADKPGWNDAMNGLPGLFGSGFGETIELKRLIDFILKVLNKYPNETVVLLKELYNLALNFKDDLNYDERLTLLEDYRNNYLNNELTEVKAFDLIAIYENINRNLEIAIQRGKDINKLYPTYLTYEATKYELIKKDNKEVIGNYGLPLVKVNEFKIKPISPFLEAPTRYLKALSKKEEALEIYKLVKNSELYDKKLKFYKTSVDLTNESLEIGRIKAFQKGWLERESNFLHMTYKYLLSLIVSGLYDEFYEEIKTNFTCYMDPLIYGRNPLENSSFIVPTNNPDNNKHGEGFFARLSGSTSEVISMWRYMFLGNQLFDFINNELIFKLTPVLHKSYFKDNIVKTTLFKDIQITYYNMDNINTYEGHIYKYEVFFDNKKYVIENDFIKGEFAYLIRNKKINKINAYLKGGKKI